MTRPETSSTFKIKYVVNQTEHEQLKLIRTALQDQASTFPSFTVFMLS